MDKGLKPVRLDKYLSDIRQNTRSQIRELIKAGRVTVDSNIVKDFGMKVTPSKNIVTVDGIDIYGNGYAEFEYYMLNKPSGVVSANEDKFCRTVMDCMTGVKKKGLFPAGRLDKDTEGLLLITDDGQMAHMLLSPKKHVDKKYYAVIDGDFNSEMKEKLESGVHLGDFVTLPAKVCVIFAGHERSEVEITIHEGKFHQVKRMFEAVGRNVTYLKRISMGPLVLDENLKPGDYRPLTKSEIDALKYIIKRED